MEGSKCFMKYCNNRSSQGEFVGKVCSSCYHKRILKYLRDAEFSIEMASISITEENQKKYCKTLNKCIEKINKIIKKFE